MVSYNPNILYLKLGKQLDIGDMKEVRVYLRKTHLAPAILTRCDDFPDICEQLEKTKKIVPKYLDFKFLSKMFEELDMGAFKDVVEEFVVENLNEDVMISALKKYVEDNRCTQEEAIQEKFNTLDLLFNEAWSWRRFDAICRLHMQRRAKRLKLQARGEWIHMNNVHEQEWDDTLNWDDPKRVSDWQKMEWVRLAERQKKEYRRLEKRQVARIKAFVDGLPAEMREKLARMQQSCRANGTVSESHSVPPGPEPNC